MVASPRLWILSGGRKGDLDQMVTLARATGWTFDVKQLSFAGPGIPILAPLLLEKRKTSLQPPWPDVLLCAEASTSMIAREIKKKSAGATRIVCIGRPAGSAAAFDLVITTAQYRVPAAANVVELSLPLSAAPLAARQDMSETAPIVLVVGGPAFPDRLDSATAQRLAGDALAHAAAQGRSLAVLTSPRTPREVADIFRRNIAPPHSLHVFGEGENRYTALLGEAAEIIVTSDSVSMVADALANGRPVSVYRLPQVHSLKWRLGEWLHHHAIERRSRLFTPVGKLFDAGVIEAAADRRLLFARLRSEGRLGWFGDIDRPRARPAGQSDFETALESLRALMAGGA